MTTPAILDPRGRFSLEGKHALISGAAGGIGSATARLCQELGATVSLVDIAVIERTVSAFGAGGTGVRAFQCDLSQRAEVDQLAKAVGAVDILIDASGLCPYDDWLSPDWDDSFERVINANVRGPINLARAFQAEMVARRSGRMVFCGSLAGWTGGLRSGAHYAFSKGGLHAFVRWLAQRLTPHNVLVNAIAPGTTNTPMTNGQGYNEDVYPLKRFASPEEMACAIAFLCAPAASFIAGTVIDVNGGIYMR